MFLYCVANLNISPSSHGDLRTWAKQGVLLLNSILTVEHKKPASHKKLGWQIFTDTCIELIGQKKKGLVFMLWGNYAKGKAALLNSNDHLICYLNFMCVLLIISSHKKQLRSILVNILTVSLLFATSEHETPYNQFGVWFCTKMANYCSPEITHLLYFVHVAIQNNN